jgi:hypothetical protein
MAIDKRAVKEENDNHERENTAHIVFCRAIGGNGERREQRPRHDSCRRQSMGDADNVRAANGGASVITRAILAARNISAVVA